MGVALWVMLYLIVFVLMVILCVEMGKLLERVERLEVWCESEDLARPEEGE